MRIGGYGTSFDYSKFYKSNDSMSQLFNNNSNNKKSFSVNNDFLSSITDYSMIRSGIYKKALNSYYTKLSAGEDTSFSMATGIYDTRMSLSNMKASSNSLKSSAAALQKSDYSEANRDDLLKDVKSFAEDYNSTINSAKKMNSTGILQNAIWITDASDMREKMLSDAGITINDDNTISVNDDKFKAAKDTTLKTLFSGSYSWAADITKNASSMYIQSLNQMASNAGNTLYNRNGSFF